MATHRYILSMGHRNTNKGGARGEYEWTPGATRALRDAIVARGGKAVIIQEISGTGDFYNGGLQQAASACVTAAKKHGPFDAYISMHYNGGGGPGAHAIHPDAWSGTDIKANNPLDVKLARAIIARIKATKTVGLLSWSGWKDTPGVMSERETGVGAQGFRLGEMVGTLGFRDTTARVIVEAGSIDVARERAYITDPGWVRKVYAEAIVDALEDVFGTFKRDESPAPQPDPKPEPKPLYAPFRPSAVLQRFQGMPETSIPIAVRDGDVWWSRTMQTVTVMNPTPRLQYANGDKVGPDLKPGETAFIAFHTVSDGKPVGYSFYSGGGGTRINLEDTDFGVPEGVAA